MGIGDLCRVVEGKLVRWLGLNKIWKRALVIERFGSMRDRRGLLLTLRYSGQSGFASGLREDTIDPKDDGFERRCVNQQYWLPRECWWGGGW